MSSKFEVKRICEHCKKEFLAHTTKTRFCSHKCASRAYKENLKSLRVEISNIETQKVISQPVDELKRKEFLSVREVSKLLNCSIRTVYYYIDSRKLNALKLSERVTRIRRSDIDELFEQSKQEIPQPESKPEPVQYDFSDCYMLSEVRSKYGISDGALHHLIKRHNIPKLKKWKCTYVPKQLIDNIFNAVK